MYLEISNPMDYHAALYIRLSKEDESEGPSQSVTNQKSLLDEFVQKHRLQVYDTYIDDGWSGTNFDRPDFQRMIGDIEAKKVNMVITKDLSRLGRDYIMTGHYMERYFPEKRVRYISLLDGLRGGSTISQQTAKNVFCLPSRTWIRKGFEAYYTLLIETFWSKRRIMEVYLNVIETGENMYGVEAPARHIYGKSAEKLNRHEASMIATVLPNPIRMKLANPSSYMMRRSAQVRSLMNKLPVIDFDHPENCAPISQKRR